MFHLNGALKSAIQITSFAERSEAKEVPEH